MLLFLRSTKILLGRTPECRGVFFRKKNIGKNYTFCPVQFLATATLRAAEMRKRELVDVGQKLNYCGHGRDWDLGPGPGPGIMDSLP